jgi:hypothetical protein
MRVCVKNLILRFVGARHAVPAAHDGPNMLRSSAFALQCSHRLYERKWRTSVTETLPPLGTSCWSAVLATIGKCRPNA